MTSVFLIRKFNGCPGGEYFGASWADILPMDQEIHSKLMPFQFSELWIDIEDTSKAMKVLKEYWEESVNLDKTGTFSWEFYPGKSGGYDSKPGGAWIRPNYGKKVFRIDVLWFDIKTNNPYTFYTPLWNKLIKNNIFFRPHWAKWFPGGNVEFPIEHNKYKKWSDYYSDQYPKWKQWHKLRKKLDPRNIFVSNYWAQALNIKISDHNDPFYNNNNNKENDYKLDDDNDGRTDVIYSNDNNETELLTTNKRSDENYDNEEKEEETEEAEKAQQENNQEYLQ